jgi:hypothetical protein
MRIWVPISQRRYDYPNNYWFIELRLKYFRCTSSNSTVQLMSQLPLKASLKELLKQQCSIIMSVIKRAYFGVFCDSRGLYWRFSIQQSNGSCWNRGAHLVIIGICLVCACIVGDTRIIKFRALLQSTLWYRILLSTFLTLLSLIHLLISWLTETISSHELALFGHQKLANFHQDLLMCRCRWERSHLQLL